MINADHPFILITDYIYLRRMNLNGSNYLRTSTHYYIHGLDFDYR